MALFRSRTSRRAFLRGALGGSVVTVGLPLLASLAPRRAHAADSGFPVRFGVFFWGNGNRPDFWTPTGEGAEWELSEELAPLAPYKSWITVVSGMAVKLSNIEPHGSGAAGMLAGTAYDETAGFLGPSIDQIVANEVGAETLYASLVTGATDCNGVSYNGPNSRNPPETDPYALYEKLFGETFREPGSSGIVDPTLGLRRSALDAVMGDLAVLNARVGAEDKVRLEQHLDGVRELEQRLAKLQEDPPSYESCARPTEPASSYPDVDGRPQISARSRAVCDMLAMALACDQTRVFMHIIDDPVSNVLFPDASSGHHELTHNETGDQPEVHAITLQCVEEFAYLVGALAAVPEGDETLLDHCAVLGCSEVSEGQTHSIEDLPLVIAGSASGVLQTGLHYRSASGENVSKVMLTLARATGCALESFGEDDAYSDDGLSDIEV